MKPINKYLIYLIIIFINFLPVNFIVPAWAGPNANSGCALDLDYLTRNYEGVNIFEQAEPSISTLDNEEIIIAVTALKVSDLDTWQADILFDADCLKFIKAYETIDNISNFLNKHKGSTIWMPGVESNKGKITIANSLKGTDTKQAPDGSGIIAFLKFEVKDVSEDIPITLSNVNFLDSMGNHDIITNTQNAVITLKDTICPSVEITSAVSKAAPPISVTITFSEPVHGFESSDIIVSNGTISDFKGSEAEYSFLLLPSALGIISIDIPENSAKDETGNSSVQAAQHKITYNANNEPAISGTQDDTKQDEQASDDNNSKPDEEIKETGSISNPPEDQDNNGTQTDDSQNKPNPSVITYPPAVTQDNNMSEQLSDSGSSNGCFVNSLIFKIQL